MYCLDDIRFEQQQISGLSTRMARVGTGPDATIQLIRRDSPRFQRLGRRPGSIQRLNPTRNGVVDRHETVTASP